MPVHQSDIFEDEKSETTNPSTPERPVNQNTQRRAHHNSKSYGSPRKKLLETPEEILKVFYPALLKIFKKS